MCCVNVLQVDNTILQTLCQQHGQLRCFAPNIARDQVVVGYVKADDAAKAQKALNLCMLAGASLIAEFISEAEIAHIVEQNGSMLAGGGQSRTSGAGPPSLYLGGPRTQAPPPFPSPSYGGAPFSSNQFGSVKGAESAGRWSSGPASSWGFDDHAACLPSDLLGGQ